MQRAGRDASAVASWGDRFHQITTNTALKLEDHQQTKLIFRRRLQSPIAMFTLLLHPPWRTFLPAFQHLRCPGRGLVGVAQIAGVGNLERLVSAGVIKRNV